MSEWRTIDSAPKDETILVAGVAWVRGGQYETVTAAQVSDFHCYAVVGGQLVYDDGVDNACLVEINATHWMPLPEPPSD